MADHGDGESDYGQTEEELAANMMEDVERKWAVALNKKEGDGVEEEKEEEEEYEKMELEEYIR